MSSQNPPSIPPRPSRSPHQSSLAAGNGPKIPPRPSHRIDRSMSPLRHSYAPSPLNEPPNGASLSRTSSSDVPQRPPSVTIPSLGEEGIEYEDIPAVEPHGGHTSTPAETRNVGSDLKLHAPRPSLPTSSAKAQVQAVTRTDSRQAAAAGLGGVGPDHDEHPERPTRSLHSRASGSRPDSSTASHDRHQSIDDEHGIPEIGQRVPMYPNAGDVQAPSPSPYVVEHETNGKRPGRGHNRSRSGRESSLPPGSYGLHGHGVNQNDKFEKAWYEKHPDEFIKEEQGQYGPGVGTPRPTWALSSDDLNKIVRGSAVTGSGLGTSPAVSGTPEEEIGYMASDEYTHRLSSPPPDSRHDTRPVVESPLRVAKVPGEVDGQDEKDAKANHRKSEEPGIIHVDEPYHHMNHPDGFAPNPDPGEHVHAHGDDEEEEEPILAADEVRPESAFQHPAVSPTFSRRESMEQDRSHTPSVHSRSNSRSASRHGSMPTLARFSSRDEREGTHTPLEDVEEYEPLFPEDDTKQKPLSTVERFKQRPDMTKHRFPSQDIWEDSPNSLQLHATVSTPDVPKRDNFETPEQESFRRSHADHVDPHQVATHILEAEDHEHENDDKEPSRPEIAKQRFPSRDIWEDAPESQKLVTTIEPSEAEHMQSPIVPTKPHIPARPQKQAPPVDASTKPISPIEKKQPPVIPARPKPQIPERPAKPVSRPSNEEVKDPATKPKPAVPARPGGSKIAALKAGFLTDLNSRLQVGPQGPKPPPKKEEPPAEKAPLSDARKGRARGPARRKPAAEPAATRLPTIPEVKITASWNVWQIGSDGSLTVGDQKQEDQSKAGPPDTTLGKTTMAAPLSMNAAGESTDPQLSPEKEEAKPLETGTTTEHHTEASTEAAPDTSVEATDKQEQDKPDPSSIPIPETPVSEDPKPSFSSTVEAEDPVEKPAAATTDEKKELENEEKSTE